MTAETRIYRAFTMAEALAAVKRDLGASAVILHTRATTRKAWFGLRNREIVEVTAVSAETARRLQARSKPPQPAVRSIAPAARRAYTQALPASKKPAGAQGATEADRDRTRLLAEAMLEKHERRKTHGAKQRADEPIALAPPPRATTPTKAVALAQSGPRPAAPSTARRFMLTDPEKPAKSRKAADRVVEITPAAAAANGRSLDGEWQEMQDELTAIRTMVGEVLQRQHVTTSRSTPTMPRKLFDMYLKLIAQDLSEELADEIVNDVRNELNALELEDEQTVADAVRRRLRDCVPVANTPLPPPPADGRPFTIALIGPTGVGKTTTLAKLAASFKLRHGKSVGMITCDSYRIAAVEQLRTYASIIGLPLEVAQTPEEMQRAVRTLSDNELILIDTAGRSQNDVQRIEELAAMVKAARPHEVHLVLSSTASEKVLMREAESFMQVGVDRIMLTKLDEAVSFGVLVNVMHRLGRQLSYITTGQEVPDHIEVGRSDRLADLVLAGEARG